VQVADIGEYDFVLKFKDAKITKPLDVTTVKMADAEGDDKNPK